MSTVDQVKEVAPSFKRLVTIHPTLRADWRGTYARMAWVCNRDESDAALQVIGGVAEDVVIGTQTVTRIIPLVHPRYEWLQAESVEAEDFGLDRNTGEESTTRIMVSFRTPEYDLEGDEAYMSFSGSPAERMVAAPATAIQFADASNPSHDPNMRVMGADFTVTLHKLATFELDKYLGYCGYANAAPWFGVAAGGALLIGPQWNRTTTIGGVKSWQVGLAFRATNALFPWNSEFKSDGEIATAYYGGTTSLRHPLIDFYNVLV